MRSGCYAQKKTRVANRHIFCTTPRTQSQGSVPANSKFETFFAWMLQATRAWFANQQDLGPWSLR